MPELSTDKVEEVRSLFSVTNGVLSAIGFEPVLGGAGNLCLNKKANKYPRSDRLRRNPSFALFNLTISTSISITQHTLLAFRLALVSRSSAHAVGHGVSLVQSSGCVSLGIQYTNFSVGYGSRLIYCSTGVGENEHSQLAFDILDQLIGIPCSRASHKSRRKTAAMDSSFSPLMLYWLYLLFGRRMVSRDKLAAVAITVCSPGSRQYSRIYRIEQIAKSI